MDVASSSGILVDPKGGCLGRKTAVKTERKASNEAPTSAENEDSWRDVI
jgi:hypothetical protein